MYAVHRCISGLKFGKKRRVRSVAQGVMLLLGRRAAD